MSRSDQRSTTFPDTTASGLGRTTAVLIYPETRSSGSAVHQQLVDRGWAITDIHHPHQAMAELCVLEKNQASRSAWGLPRADHLAMVIDWPEASPELDQLKAAVSRYLPEVNVWFVRGDSVMSSSGTPLPPIAQVEKLPLETPPVETPTEAEPQPQQVTRPFSFSANLSSQETSNGGMAVRSVGGAPPLHLVHADLPLPARPAPPIADAELDQTDEPEAQQRITREEIDMLLHQETGEQTP